MRAATTLRRRLEADRAALVTGMADLADDELFGNGVRTLARLQGALLALDQIEAGHADAASATGNRPPAGGGRLPRYANRRQRLWRWWRADRSTGNSPARVGPRGRLADRRSEPFERWG